MNERIAYCMPSRCPLSADCQRFEDDAARHSLQRTYADFSEELVRPAGGPVNCPFFVGKAGAVDHQPGIGAQRGRGGRLRCPGRGDTGQEAARQAAPHAQAGAAHGKRNKRNKGQVHISRP